MSSSLDNLDTWNDSDFKQYSARASGFDIDPGLLDAFSGGVVQGFKSGPTMSAVDYFTADSGKKYMTAEEANQKYGLNQTPVAFKEDGDLISDNHAQNVLRNHLETANTQARLKAVEEDYGAIGSAANFAGNLSAGMFEPTNLLAGFGAAKVFGGLVAKVGTAGMKSVIVNRSVQEASKAALGFKTRDVIAVQLLENFGASLVTDAALVPLGEDVLNKKVPLGQRVFNIMGGTVLGGAIGTGLEARALSKLRADAHAFAKQHGSQAEDVAVEAMTHGTMNHANGKKPNYDHPVQVREQIHFNTRPNQNPYAFEIMDSGNIYDRQFYVGRDASLDEFDQVSYAGEGTIVVSDNYNYVNNRMSPLDGKVKGDVVELKISKKSKIMTFDEFQANKPVVRKAILDLYDSAEFTNKKVRSNFANALNRAIEESTELADVADSLHVIMSDPNGIGARQDFHNIGNLDDFINKALWDNGWSGYHRVGKASTIEGSDFNQVVMFKPESFVKDPKKVKNSLYFRQATKEQPTTVKEGWFKQPQMKSIKQTRGMIQTEAGNGYFFNTRMFDVMQAREAQAFDPNHPFIESYLKPIKELEKAEIKRLADPKQDLAYHDPSMKQLEQTVNEGQIEPDTDPVTILQENEGRTLDEIDPETLSKEGQEALDLAKKGDDHLAKLRKTLTDICLTRD